MTDRKSAICGFAHTVEGQSVDWLAVGQHLYRMLRPMTYRDSDRRRTRVGLWLGAEETIGSIAQRKPVFLRDIGKLFGFGTLAGIVTFGRDRLRIGVGVLLFQLCQGLQGANCRFRQPHMKVGRDQRTALTNGKARARTSRGARIALTIDEGPVFRQCHP